MGKLSEQLATRGRSGGMATARSARTPVGVAPPRRRPGPGRRCAAPYRRHEWGGFESAWLHASTRAADEQITGGAAHHVLDRIPAPPFGEQAPLARPHDDEIVAVTRRLLHDRLAHERAGDDPDLWLCAGLAQACPQRGRTCLALPHGARPGLAGGPARAHGRR